VSGDCTLEKKEIEKLFFGFTIEAQKQLSRTFYQPKKKVVVIAGPTGCGKSAFSIPLAQEVNGEIISADSMQIYRGMDIGTAKATQEMRDAVPHHLIDIRPINEPFNVVDFYFEARHCCQIIQARECVPIIVGGSGFYLHSLMFGPPNGPPSVPELRQSLEEEIEIQGAEILFQRLKQLDPQYAATITKNDKQKIVRALEIISLTGKKVSQLSWKGRKTPQNYDFRCWFLHRPRDSLYSIIDKRCEEMIENGLLLEVERLVDEGLLENSSACQAIGYRQALDYFRSAKTKQDFDKFVDEFKKASRRYAKRQFTWFRHEPAYRWLDMDMLDQETALEIVIKDLKE
jgi:tRNA dimethylallyltransferase